MPAAKAATAAPHARARQREATRERIVAAAIDTFAEKGFRGASTREIARRAGTNQGLITYHFRSKDALWRAAVDTIFARLESEWSAAPSGLDPRETAREAIRSWVRFAAAHPELLRFMVNEGRESDERMRWLVETHIRPRYADLASRTNEIAGLPEALLPHFFYALVGAGSLIFSVAPECRRLTGLDPTREEAIETHAEFVARLILP